MGPELLLNYIRWIKCVSSDPYVNLEAQKVFVFLRSNM